MEEGGIIKVHILRKTAAQQSAARETGLIVIDWGTTNFRAFLLGSDGAVLDCRSSTAGLLNVPDKNFAGTLRVQVADWLQAGETTIVMCGMVGSRYGWVEAPYVRCPAGIADLSAALLRVPFPDAEVWIVPGVETEDADGVPEIMRGEETAALGIMQGLQADSLICFPGSHSKWVRVEGGRIETFSTFMTGEVFAALRRHTILSQFIQDDSAEDKHAFRRGVDHAGDGSGLLHRVFAARTLPLKGRITEASTGAFLSGLLIGSEVRAVVQGTAEVVLVGAAPLCALYADAITRCGGRARLIQSEAAARGLWLLGEAVQARGGKATHATT